jgi:hypothetical protein
MTGIYVEVPADKTGSLRVELDRVTVRDTALHGVHVNDANSATASVRLTITESRFNKNFDDGIDIDERNGGSIFSNMEDVKATKNLDQGITFDERLNGDVSASISNSTVTGNDKGSQNIDLRGKQNDDGTGTLTLENVVIGQSALTGLLLITDP